MFYFTTYIKYDMLSSSQLITLVNPQILEYVIYRWTASILSQNKCHKYMKLFLILIFYYKVFTVFEPHGVSGLLIEKLI